MHLTRVDLDRCELGFAVVRAADVGRELATVSEMVGARTGEAVVGVNGDFFTEEGRPVGPEVVRGTVTARGERPAFAWQPGERARIGPTSWGEGSVAVDERDFPLARVDGPGLEVVGGFPQLLPPVPEDRRGAPDFAGRRHPRTAVGLDPEERAAWLVVVEGRSERSDGMTLEELTDLLEALGAVEALNLDGGGSSVMVLHGEPVSAPSGAAGERRVVNALVVVEDEGFCAVS